MFGPWCSLNGKLIPAAEACVGVDDIDFAYGYGVYETLKVRKRVLFFPMMHTERLLHSAAAIGLPHPFTAGEAAHHIRALAIANACENANIKVLLLGGPDRDTARLYVMALPPLFPDRKLYREGAEAIVYPGERAFPRAKTLNMLVSTIAFRVARAAGAYDAILRSRDGLLTEGTRTNLFFTDGDIIYTPPADTVLEGVTKITLAQALEEEGIPLAEKALPESGLASCAGVFLSSTSTKIIPLRQAGCFSFGIPQIIRRAMSAYDSWLERYAGAEAPLF